MPALFHLRNSTTSEGPGVECLQPSLDFTGKLCVSSSGSSSSSSVQVSGRTCQWSTQTFDSGGAMLDGGFLASHSSQHVGRCSSVVPIIKNLIMDVSVGQALKGLQYLHLTLCQLSNVFYADRGSLPQSVRAVAGATQLSMSKVYQQCWKEWTGWCAWQGLPNNAISAPKLADFFCSKLIFSGTEL